MRRGCTRPPPGPGLGAAHRGGRGGASSGVVRHPLPGLQRQALPREAGRRAQRPAQLQLGPADLAGPRAGARGAAPPTGASARAGRCRGCTRTAHAGRPVGSGRHPRRCHLRGLLGLLRRRGGRQLPGPPRGGARAVRSTPAVTTSTPRRPAARSTRTTRPRSDAPCANSATPTPPRRGGGACSPPCRSACPRNSGSPPTSTRPTPSSNRSTCPATTDASQPRPRGSAFVPFAGALDDILCRGAHRLQRQHRALQETLPATPDRPPPPPLRQGQGPGHPDHTLAVFHGCLARYRSDGQPFHTYTREAA